MRECSSRNPESEFRNPLNWYRLNSWLHYRLRAKGRHGVHSPFVFDFIEKGLRARSGTLQEKIEAYFGTASLRSLEVADPHQWPGVLERMQPAPQHIIVVSDIHRSLQHTRSWEALCAHPSVRLSIDLFDLGLLFFREEFRERQHFVLKQY